jgi:GAF domain-containing protein/HAMP domain-containing protein
MSDKGNLMNTPVTHPFQQEESRRKNARIISLSTGIVFLIATAVLGPVGYIQNGIHGLWGVYVTGLVSLAGFISAFLVARGRVQTGILTLIATILTLSCGLPLLAHGQGIALGIMVLIVVAGISSSTLPPTSTRHAFLSAFAIAIFIVITDLYLPEPGLPTNPTYTNTVAVIASVVYAAFIIKNFRTYTLRTKIILTFITITMIPLAVLSLINSRLSTQAIQAQSEAQLTSLASITAKTVDDFILVQMDSIQADTKQVTLVEFLANPADAEAEKNAYQTLLGLTRKDPVFIRSVAILDANGINVLDTFEKNKERNESLYSYFMRPSQTSLPYVSNVTFRAESPSIFFSAPIKNTNRETIGVLRIEYHAAVLQSIVQSLVPENSETVISIVDINTYLRTAHTGDRESLFKSFKPFGAMELVALQSDGRLPIAALWGTSEAIVAGMDRLQQERLFYLYSETNVPTEIYTGQFLENQPWVALVSQSTDVYLAPVEAQQRTNSLISILLVIFSIITGYVAAEILTSPLSVLTKVAERVTGGDLNAQAEINTADEIGALATTFNRMTSQLNQTLTGLEQRVAERTTDLELSRQQSVKRASELLSIGEISKIITGEQKLETLLPLITRLVSERFDFYHTGIFLVDSTSQFAVLQAASSPGGRNMLKRGHKLEIGGNSIVGYVTKYGVPRISLDVGSDAVYFNNPDLPTTRSEITLPLKIRERIVGALDVQSEKPGAFTENDANTLSILADQVTIAIENARLFTQTQEALDEVQTLYRRNLQEGWKAFGGEREFVGYRQSMTQGRKLKQAFESDETRQAINRGELLIFHADGVTEEAAMVVPIKLRGQVIGSINIKAPVKFRQWSNDEINLAEIISERLSIALENARLIQESQIQAVKEQKISEVTGKIGASINLKNVLQTAVEELGRAMPGSDVVIQLKHKDQ